MKIFNYIKSHKNKIRLFYWLIVILVMIFIVLPMFVFFYRFDEERVKRMIIDQFDNNYLVEVGGQTKPKFWHGLSLEIANIRIATRDDVQLINVKNVSCQLSWLDLAIGRYKVKRLALNGVDINEDNIANYTTKGLLNLSHLPNSAFSSLNSVDIYGMQTVGDKQVYKISDGVLCVKQNRAGAMFKFGIKLADYNTYLMTDGYISSISDDIVHFSDFNMQIYNTQMRLSLKAQTNYQVKNNKLVLAKLVGNIALNSYFGRILADELTFSLLGAEVTNGQVSLDFANNFANQNIIATFNVLSAAHFNQIAINQLQLKYIARFDNNQLNLNSSLDGLLVESSGHITTTTCINHLNFTEQGLNHEGVNALLSGTCEYIPQKNLINMNLIGNLDDAPLKLNLNVFNNESKPYIVAVGGIDDLDLSRLVNKAKLIPLYYDDSRLPFAWLSLFNMKANLSIGHFALDRINLDNLLTQFAVSNNNLIVNKIQANVYNGILSGSAAIAKTNNGYNIKTKEKIKNLSIQSMFKDLFNVQAINGQGNLTMDVFANNVISYDDLHKCLNGKIVIDANHGAFQGVDFNLFVNPEALNLSASKSTVFDHLRADLNFINGVSKNGNLMFSSPYVIANGGGTLDFVKTTLDYNMSIRSALPQNAEKINAVLIPVSINGDLFSPKISIQNIHLFMGETKSARIPLRVKHLIHNAKPLRWGSKLKSSKGAKSNASKTVTHHKF